MRSVIHVEANTVEDLRRELLDWLDRQIISHRASATFARLMRDINLANAKVEALSAARDFWSNVTIDPKPKDSA